MCGIPIATALISAASAAAGAYGSQQSAQAQMDSAAAAANLEQQQLQLQRTQVNQQAAQESFERRRETDRTLGKILAASGASGVSGVSLGRQQAATGVSEGLDLGVISANREARQQQAGMSGLQIDAKRRSRTNAARASAASPLSAALGIGGSGLQGYATGLSIKRELDKR